MCKQCDEAKRTLEQQKGTPEEPTARWGLLGFHIQRIAVVQGPLQMLLNGGLAVSDLPPRSLYDLEHSFIEAASECRALAQLCSTRRSES